MKRRDRTKYARAYYAKNRIRLLAYQKKWREQNLKHFKELRQAWLAKQPHKTDRRWGIRRFDKKAYQRKYDQRPERKAARLAAYKERGPRPRPGWTRELRAQILLDQQGKCAVCQQVFAAAPHQDHDWSTGKRRGLLCASCNLMIGKSGDSPVVLRTAAEYIEKYR